MPPDCYLDGLEQWKEVLRNNREFHRPPRSDRIEEQTYEYELAYLRMLVQDDQGVREKANEVIAPARGVIPFLTFPYPETLRQSQLAANERAQQAAPGFLRAFVPTPYPRVLTRAQLAINEPAERLRAAAPAFLRPYLPEPFPNPEADPPTQTPQWSNDAQVDLNWYVAENLISPLRGLMDVADDRRFGPWVKPEVKETVRVQQGIQCRVQTPPSSGPLKQLNPQSGLP